MQPAQIHRLLGRQRLQVFDVTQDTRFPRPEFLRYEKPWVEQLALRFEKEESVFVFVHEVAATHWRGSVNGW